MAKITNDKQTEGCCHILYKLDVCSIYIATYGYNKRLFDYQQLFS